MNEITKQKRAELALYIEKEVLAETAVQGIVVIGSVAKGIARPDSDIDAVVFLDPFDYYAVPAESKWQPATHTFHSIFADVADAIQLDFKRIDLAVWQQPDFVWPESLCAELSEGWVAFDRNGRIQPLIAERTQYNNHIRQARLDDAIVALDWLLNESTTNQTWQLLGANVAHYRLHSASEYLVQALFAYNRQWRTFRSRELADLLNLSWLPNQFEAQFLLATNALSTDYEGYEQRVAVLNQFFKALVTQCQQDGLYGEDAVGEAFIREHNEPGYAWDMEEWSRKHNDRNR